ncbi:TetR/AcrR family transcriptional regulator [Afifella sp. IM 167]|uniref:TetR/AcrR family transcriptional regulator n=1 Tax=Afifella sp. IM 167 TaxID=2033586 RepID=UPI001CC9E686|nr:TetR/AcrR family transcriptional regulator [Afifella sp. IM 167]MBZ8134797.1 TetR family transcriptional regulator [Afifella sp. IM 167]
MSEMQPWEHLIEEAATRQHDEERVLKQDRSRQRSAEILDAAVRVFARDGLVKARVADIAAEAGVPLPSLYDYFKGKAELAYAVPIARQSEFFQEFSRQAREMETSRERLAHFLWLTTDFARRNPDWAQVLYLEIWPSVLVRESRVRAILDDYGRIVVALIREGAERGEWPEDPSPYQTATILIGAISQLIITWLLYRRPRDLVAAAHPMVERMMTLLDNPPEPPVARRPRRTARKKASAAS